MLIERKKYLKMKTERIAKTRTLVMLAFDGYQSFKKNWSMSIDNSLNPVFIQIQPKDQNYVTGSSVWCFSYDLPALPTNKLNEPRIKIGKEGISAWRISLDKDGVWKNNMGSDENGPKKIFELIDDYSISKDTASDSAWNGLFVAVQSIMKKVLSELPFVSFEWKNDDHDHLKQNLFNNNQKIGSVWKDSPTLKTFSATSGKSCVTLSEAKDHVEKLAIQKITQRIDYSLSWLSSKEQQEKILDLYEYVKNETKINKPLKHRN